MTPEELLDRCAQEPARLGLFLDFDGTLAPIVADPEQARMPDSLREPLATLARHLAVLAVVSGRPARVLAERVPVAGVRLLGLYGLEEWEAGEVRPHPEAARWADAVGEAKGGLERRFATAEGVFVEDKGLGVAVHWRNAPHPDTAGLEVVGAVEDLARRTGLAREPGKLVEELRPPVDWDKGAAVAAAAAETGLGEPVYIGDDLGDLTAFHSVHELGGLAVLVDHGEETPAALRAEADVVLHGTLAVGEWLGHLAGRMSREH